MAGKKFTRSWWWSGFTRIYGNCLVHSYSIYTAKSITELPSVLLENCNFPSHLLLGQKNYFFLKKWSNVSWCTLYTSAAYLQVILVCSWKAIYEVLEWSNYYYYYFACTLLSLAKAKKGGYENLELRTRVMLLPLQNLPVPVVLISQF